MVGENDRCYQEQTYYFKNELLLHSEKDMTHVF